MFRGLGIAFGGGSGGGGGGGLTEEQANLLYLRLDTANSPLTVQNETHLLVNYNYDGDTEINDLFRVGFINDFEVGIINLPGVGGNLFSRKEEEVFTFYSADADALQTGLTVNLLTMKSNSNSFTGFGLKDSDDVFSMFISESEFTLGQGTGISAGRAGMRLQFYGDDNGNDGFGLEVDEGNDYTTMRLGNSELDGFSFIMTEGTDGGFMRMQNNNFQTIFNVDSGGIFVDRVGTGLTISNNVTTGINLSQVGTTAINIGTKPIQNFYGNRGVFAGGLFGLDTTDQTARMGMRKTANATPGTVLQFYARRGVNVAPNNNDLQEIKFLGHNVNGDTVDWTAIENRIQITAGSPDTYKTSMNFKLNNNGDDIFPFNIETDGIRLQGGGVFLYNNGDPLRLGRTGTENLAFYGGNGAQQMAFIAEPTNNNEARDVVIAIRTWMIATGIMASS